MGAKASLPMLLVLGLGGAWLYNVYSKKQGVGSGGGGNYVRESQVPGGMPVAVPVRIGTGGTKNAYSGLQISKPTPYTNVRDPTEIMMKPFGGSRGPFNIC